MSDLACGCTLDGFDGFRWEACRYPAALSELSDLRARLELAEKERGELCEALGEILKLIRLSAIRQVSGGACDRATRLLSRIAASKGRE